MDRDAIARDGRRAQALEALAFEEEREAALREQVAAIVLEQEGERIDREAFPLLDPEDVRRVRDALGHVDEDDTTDEDDPFADPDDLYVSFEDDTDDEPAVADEDEIARLEREIEVSRAAQSALTRYVAALDEAGQVVAAELGAS